MTERADVLAIEAIRRRLEAAENAGEADVFADVIADDVVVMVPDFPVKVGKAESAAFVRDVSAWMHENLNRRIEYTSDEVSVIGPLAFDRGTFTFTAAFKDGRDPAAVTGKYLWVYRRDDAGAWQLWRWIVTRDEADDEHESDD